MTLKIRVSRISYIKVARLVMNRLANPHLLLTGAIGTSRITRPPTNGQPNDQSSDFISVISLVMLSLASPKSIMHFSL